MRLKGEKKRETYDKLIFTTNIMELLQGKQFRKLFLFMPVLMACKINILAIIYSMACLSPYTRLIYVNSLT